MANPHHRKKHKEHLRQFQKSRTSYTADVKSKSTNIFTLVGGIMGLVVSFLSASDKIIWIIAGTLIGAAAGYLLGKGIENSGKE
jgi:hypothetical protein